MNKMVPLRDVATRRLNLRDAGGWPDQQNWIPVSTTELHLAARSFPLAVRRGGDSAPQLGLLVSAVMLGRPLRAADGAWRGGYQPIGLRTSPLVAVADTDDALGDLAIDPDAPCLSADEGVPIVDRAGRPTPPILELHRMAVLLTRSAAAFAPALDHLMIAGLLAPLSTEACDTPVETSDLVIDPGAFERLDGSALGAMARHSYLSVDIAMAAIFSLQALHPSHRPRRQRGSADTRLAHTAAIADIPFDDLALALDDGELIPFG